MNAKLITIKTYFNRIQADLSKTALAGAGIEAFVVGIDIGGAGSGGMGGIRLQVMEKDAKDALEILKDS